ncbi:NPCBM/NEW2 domain-containing protein [Paenibacillus elgii]|uniref:NPCBM/NEW2 domain-containing protein n=1 Tax=Paenibacillus elgii TaxID=189691 RepID=UPI00203B1D95|nr:NPCBM/NEW2 domain-containing protein [Paenibacillus elgii]MCM3274189.1 NPCBM/NEW2 domain-containing protein [Paenibacillus elgii]
MNSSLKDKFKGAVIGSIVTLAFTSSVTFAAGTQIEVYFKNIKFMIDGVEKQPKEGKGFIYDGTTYVPLRFAGESLGKSVEWDGENETIWIGKKEGDFKYLDQIEYATSDKSGNYNKFYFSKLENGKFKIAGTEYSHGLAASINPFMDYNQNVTIDYNLNGQFSVLKGFTGIDDSTKDVKLPIQFKIIGDGKEIYSATLNGGDIPKPVEISVKNVARLQIQFKYEDKNYNMKDQLAVFADAKLIQ